MKKFFLCTALALSVLPFASAQKQDTCKPINLICDHLVKPLGIDNPSPRLSWMLDDSRKGARQTAYQIVVGCDSLEVMERGKYGIRERKTRMIS